MTPQSTVRRPEPPPAAGLPGTGRRPLAYLLVLALALGLAVTGGLVTGASPAAAAPPTVGRVYLQNVLNGYAISADYGGTPKTTRPQGDEKHQQWEFRQLPGNNTYQIKNSTRTDACLGRNGDMEGFTPSPVVRPCDAYATDWVLESIGPERYRLKVPSTGVPLVGAPAGDNASELTLGTGAENRRDEWYVIPADVVAEQKHPMPADPRLDQKTFLTAHNSFVNDEDDPIRDVATNQPHSIARQLEDGVEALMLDTRFHDGQVRLCHNSCGPGQQTLVSALQTVTSFMKRPGNEKKIITLFLEDYTEPFQLKAALAQVPAVAELVYNPETSGVRSKGWPRLSEMTDRRLLIFSDRNQLLEADGVMFGQDWTVENHWSMGPGLGNSDWNCRSRWPAIPLSLEKGDREVYVEATQTWEREKFNRLFVMNHFRDAPLSPTYTNDNSKVLNRAERFCTPAARKKPTYLAVDQYKDGDPAPLASVAQLNTYTYNGSDLQDAEPGGPMQPGEWNTPRLAVMPLGDSITLGVGSTTRTGYRPGLAARLAGRATSLEFVGSLQDPDGTRHEGHSGWRIDQLAAGIDGWMATARPNVVLLHIGTNDMNRNYQVGTATQRLGGLVDQIHAASPDTAIVLASLVPATDPAVQARVDAYNNALPGLVASRTALGYRITQVGMGALTTADLNDDLHPNNAGYTKMADAFLGGIETVVRKGWVKEFVDVRPAPPARATAGDYDVDIDGDGRADYLAVDANGAVRAWRNTGLGSWEALGYIASGSSAWTGGQVRFADVDGDGRADYLVLDGNGAVRAYLNRGGDGRGGWVQQGVIATGSSAWTGSQVRFADIDGDARADYLVLDANGAVRAWRSTALGSWEELGYIASGSSAWSADRVRFADIGGDGRADYLVLDENGAVRAFVNQGGNGRGGWQELGYIASGSSAWTADQVRFADVGGDARADYLVLEADGSLQAFVGSTDAAGTIRWAAPQVIATGVGAPAHEIHI
ncbi:FG-GAP-like repeat-containing protein [Streptomyces termitum]|uniref:SGNH hydrolase-type esterase domain-containing protein n=1 Tax=Streptomyces termitum TaxID=67368 RepID=A0A918W3R4_9ACTN|nr:FG-GAP-like repeat-containing protein [Streptomyces termitum]GHA64384.1 hypothetical protein GCM10010305_02380 [Streptomyces termitum]